MKSIMSRLRNKETANGRERTFSKPLNKYLSIFNDEIVENHLTKQKQNVIFFVDGLYGV